MTSLALRSNTHRTYDMHGRTMIELCREVGIDPLQPLSEQSLCVLAILYSRTHKITTLPNFISAIAWHAERLGHGQLPRGLQWNRVQAGLQNLFSSSNVSVPSRGFTLEDLCAMYRHIDHHSFEGARDWCACLFAFFGLLRVNEYMSAGLRFRDVRQEPWGIGLTIPFSKTCNQPAHVDLIRRDDQLCPAEAFRNYLRFVRPEHAKGLIAVFADTPSSSRALSDSDFIARIRRLIATAMPGADAMEYSGHSFRRGGASALALAGVPEATIQLHGRWSSLAYRQYYDVQHSTRVRLIATASLRAYTDAHPLPGLGPRMPQ